MSYSCFPLVTHFSKSLREKQIYRLMYNYWILIYIYIYNRLRPTKNFTVVNDKNRAMNKKNQHKTNREKQIKKENNHREFTNIK